MLTLTLLMQYALGYDPLLPKTASLERELGIGTGYHGKWYRSQQDHWMGWLEVQCRQARRVGRYDPVPARGVWQRLDCSPMMFWLAEAAGVPSVELGFAEDAARSAAAINPKDGAPHGRMMRAILSWDVIESTILACRPGADPGAAEEAAQEAFGRLVMKNSAYRRLQGPDGFDAAERSE